MITIDGIDVTSALVGSINIQHNKNQISTFSFDLGDTQYSPRINSHIDLDKEVVITVYVDENEILLFTGIIDDVEAENTPAFRVMISGMDYGKKLLDKRMTLVSIQTLAVSTKRNDVIRYIAEQAGIITMDIPEMAIVTIDNSFSDQSAWDMIQKEAMVELYWVKFDEEGTMQLKLDEIKSDIILYPTPDWTYSENKIMRLGYKKNRLEINKIIVLGKTTQSRIPTKGGYDEFYASQYWLDGEETSWDQSGEWEIHYVKDEINSTASNERGKITITHMQGEYATYYLYYDTVGHVHSGYGMGYIMPWNGASTLFTITRHIEDGVPQEGGVTIRFRGKTRDTTYETRYDQISVSVTDPNSIIKYGERDGGSIEYPLLETVEQCEAVGSKIIRDSHRILAVISFSVPFNPLLQTGQTIAIIDTKIGVDERYYIEAVNHNIDFGDGKVKARTVVGGVLYV
jgi:hypothetical protein